MKKLVIPISLLLGVVLIVGSAFFYHGDSVCSEKSNLSFYMTKTLFQWIKGTPTFSKTNDVTGNLELNYEQDELYGYPAQATYTFCRYFIEPRLCEVTYVVSDLDIEKAEFLFDQLNTANSELYSQKKHYFHDAVIDNLETDGTISTSLGTNDGATGINITIQYEDGVLCFSTMIQE